MKIRRGFISNSSSSSFIIDIQSATILTEKQLNQITNYPDSFCSKWHFEITDEKIVGKTSGNDKEMKDYLEEIGVNLSEVTWEYY